MICASQSSTLTSLVTFSVQITSQMSQFPTSISILATACFMPRTELSHGCITAGVRAEGSRQGSMGPHLFRLGHPRDHEEPQPAQHARVELPPAVRLRHGAAKGELRVGVGEARAHAAGSVPWLSQAPGRSQPYPHRTLIPLAVAGQTNV